MKRFWLFAGDHYYPFGGMTDFKGHFDTVEQAMKGNLRSEWAHVFDCETKLIVAKRSIDEGDWQITEENLHILVKAQSSQQPLQQR
jgi:hypothetical protein